MYLDTSAAVKLYCREKGSEECEAIAATADGFFSSELYQAELHGALLAKERAGIISAKLRAHIWRSFESHLAEGSMQLVALNGLVVREAIEIMSQIHPDVPLRTLDAIHLATYLSVDAGPLFTRDVRMLAAARKLNIPLAGG